MGSHYCCAETRLRRRALRTNFALRSFSSFKTDSGSTNHCDLPARRGSFCFVPERRPRVSRATDLGAGGVQLGACLLGGEPAVAVRVHRGRSSSAVKFDSYDATGSAEEREGSGRPAYVLLRFSFVDPA